MHAVRSAVFRRERWMSWYLSGAKEAPDFCAQSRQILWIPSRSWQFLWAEGLQTTRFVSSTKPRLTPLLSPLFVASRRGLINRRNSIGERGDPWGIPVSVGNGWLVWPSNSREVVLPLRNALTML